jgi:hypothetical protein
MRRQNVTCDVPTLALTSERDRDCSLLFAGVRIIGLQYSDGWTSGQVARYFTQSGKIPLTKGVHENVVIKRATCYIFKAHMSRSKNPLSKLNRQERIWLAGILKDACRERLEKNLVNQAFEERLNGRGPVKGRLDPRPFLRIWEPRYRKFLEIATDLETALQAEEARRVAGSLVARVDPTGQIRRHGPVSSQAMIEENGQSSRRKSRSR